MCPFCGGTDMTTIMGGGAMSVVFWVSMVLFWLLLVAGIFALVSWTVKKGK